MEPRRFWLPPAGRSSGQDPGRRRSRGGTCRIRGRARAGGAWRRTWLRSWGRPLRTGGSRWGRAAPAPHVAFGVLGATRIP